MSCARDTGLIPAWHQASPELTATAQSVPCHQHRSSPQPHPRPALSWPSLAGKESQTCLHSWLQRNNFSYRGRLQDPVSLLWVMPKKSLEMAPTSAHPVQRMQKSLVCGSGPLLNSSLSPPIWQLLWNISISLWAGWKLRIQSSGVYFIAQHSVPCSHLERSSLMWGKGTG